jgi:FkbM family methyltransferase
MKPIVDLCSSVLPISVVDVGANPIGDPPSYADLLSCGAINLTGFEPQSEALAKLTANALPHETYLPYAIGSGQTGYLHICRNSGFTSLYNPDPSSSALLGNQGSTRVIDTLRLETKRLDDLDEVGGIDFLKIDIQGSELDAIRAGRQKLSSAVLIQTEIRSFPLYEGESTYGDLEAELATQGFRLHSFTGIKKTTQASQFKGRMRKGFYTQLIDSDAFFVPDLRGIEDLTKEQLMKLAVLADTVMQAPDLALFCLSKLLDRNELTREDIASYEKSLPDRMMKT